MTDEVEAPVLERPRPSLDQALVDSFRAELAARKRKREAAQADAAIDMLEDSIDEIPELQPIAQADVEAPIGTGYDFDEPKTEVGGYIPTPDVSYAYQKVLAIRLRVAEIPTVEPTDFTLEEFDRIRKYNLELVERKAGGPQK
jgi:hypothetical protein